MKRLSMTWLTEYKKSLKMIEVEEIIDLIFYRPIAFLLVKSIFKTKITPDHLTIAAIIMGLAGGFFYASGLHLGYILGALFYLLFNIFDCSDGQMARLKKNGTSIGRLLDGVADYIAAIAIYAGIAFGYSKNSEHPLLILILLLLAGLSTIIQGILVDYYRTRFLDVVLERKDTFNEGIEEYKTELEKVRNQKSKWFNKSVIFIYLIYSNIQRSITARKNRGNSYNFISKDYFKKNRVIIRFWVFMGPSANITSLILCSLFCRFDIFFWIVICGFNLLAASLWIIQQKIDTTFKILQK